MTDPKSLTQIEELLVALPGISRAQFTRQDSRRISAVICCDSLAGFDALARCSTGANAAVTLGQSEASEFRTLTTVPFLKCHIDFNDNETERPTPCEQFGFYAANYLYNASLVSDSVLDKLESIWNVRFSRNAE